MSYTYENLISDLKQNENWNVIREKALDEYFQRKYKNQQLDPNVHYGVPHFCSKN